MLKTVSSISNVIGALNFKGTWNAATNTPTLASGVGTKGDYYYVSVAGNTNLDGITDWQVTDLAVFNGSQWQKIDNTDQVFSVNGQQGVVVLDAADVGAVANTTFVNATGLLTGGGQLTGNVAIDLTSVPIANVTGGVANTVEIIAGTGLTGGGNLSANVNIALANTTVTPATYGGGSNAVQITVDVQGRITTAANVAIPQGTVTNIATGTGLTGGPITSSGTVSVATNGITNTLLRDSAALSVIGRSANSTGDPADIAAGTDHQVLRRSGTTLAFGSISLNQSAAVTGTLPVSNGGTGITSFGTGVATFLGTPSSANLASAVTDETGTGALVFATSPTLVTPVLGTPQSGTLTNATGLPLSTGVTGTLPVANGGTGQTTYTNGQLLIGNTTGGTLAKATLTAGTGITVTNGAGAITVAAINNGTVTSVATGTGLTGGPITSTGTINLANTAVTAGTYGNATNVAQVTVDAQGRLTAASNVVIAISTANVTGLGTIATQNANAVAITGGTIEVSNLTASNVTVTANLFANLVSSATAAMPDPSLPLNPEGYVSIVINGATKKVPFYGV